MKKCTSFLLTLLLFFISLTPILQTAISSQKAHAEENCIYDGQSNIQMLFQGQQLDSESSLYYLRARYYDPFTGRFISKDPVKGVLPNPQTQNPYAYALNNPNSFSDPSGEEYQNINVTAGFGFGVSCGVLIDTNTREVYPYLQGGFVGRPAGVSLTLSPNDVSTGWGASGQVAFLLAGALNYDFSDKNLSPEVGIGTPGLQGTLGYTFNPIYDLDNLYNAVDNLLKK